MVYSGSLAATDTPSPAKSDTKPSLAFNSSLVLIQQAQCS